MSLLFPVFFSYLNQRSLPFVPPTLDFVPLQEERGGKRGAGEQCVVWTDSVGALNWGIPFLNHEK